MNVAMTAVAFFLSLASISCLAVDQAVPDDRIPLKSVLVRKLDVFASTERGLYRALKSERVWRKLQMPSELRPGGVFAKEPLDAKILLYCSPKSPSVQEFKGYDIYSSMDSGLSWALVSDERRFKELLLHPDGTLYAIATIVSEANASLVERDGLRRSVKLNGNGNCETYVDRIFMSGDLGRTWSDISSDIPPGMSLCWLAADPDHPALACLYGQSLRSYALQAEDKSYSKWTATPFGFPNQTDGDFLRPHYSTGSKSPLYMLSANLSNYFSYPFDDAVRLPAFLIAVAKEAYLFKRNEPLTVAVEVRFLLKEPEPRVLDIDEEYGFWGLRCIDPDGKRGKDKTLSMRSRETAESLNERILASPSLSVHPLCFGHPYARNLDLSKLFDFTKNGVYRVRLIYNSSGSVADGSRGEWRGLFSSQVFTVTIEE